MAKTPIINQTGLVFRETFRNVGDVIENGGTITGTPTISDGATLATGELIEYPFDGALQFDDEYGISCWFKLTSSASGYHTIINKWDGSDGWQLSFGNTEDFLYLYNEGGNSGGGIGVQSNTGQITSGVWYHVVAWSRASTGEGKIYINGVDQTNSATSRTLGANTDGIKIGANFSGNYLRGEVRDVRVYDGEITAEEVSDLYNETTFSEVDDAQALISLPLRSHFDDGSNEVTLNIGTSGTNPILGDGSTASTFPTQLTPHGMSFDGTDDYLDLSDSVSSLTASTGAISLWFKSTFNDTAQEMLTAFYQAGVTNQRSELILSEATGSYGDESISYIVVNSSIQLFMLVRNGNAFYRDNKWHHVAVVVDGVDNKIYIDGEPQTMTFANGGATTTAMWNITSPDTLKIGRREPLVGDNPFTGDISKPMFFNTPLTETQVKWLYQRDRRLLNI